MSKTANIHGTSGRSVTVGLPQFELVSYRGEIFGPFESISHAVQVAKIKWPDQEQDEERSGRGLDIAVVGADR